MRTAKLAFAFFGLAAALGAADPALGTWKLNVEKSKYNPGPAPKSGTVTYEASGAGIRRSGESVNAKGETSSWEYTANYDGTDYPIKGHPIADTIAVNRVNDHTTEATLKKSGKVVTTARRVVSKDGKTMTISTKGTTPDGKPSRNVAVYERQ